MNDLLIERNGPIDTGDTVRHLPTGETWTVAHVESGYLAWCGYPEGEVPVSECQLIQEATPEYRSGLLRDIARIGHESRRGRTAKVRLGAAQRAKHGPPLSEIRDRVARQIREIDLMRRDAAHWNRVHPDEEPIAWDPDGQMVRLRAWLTELAQQVDRKLST